MPLKIHLSVLEEPETRIDVYGSILHAYAQYASRDACMVVAEVRPDADVQSAVYIDCTGDVPYAWYEVTACGVSIGVIEIRTTKIESRSIC